MARTDPTIYMRIPQELKDALDKASAENRRSLTAEVVARLQATLDETVITTIEARAKLGAEEKRFEFNADEIAEKVAQKLSGSMVQPISLDVLREKYLLPRESEVEDLYFRMARAIFESDPDFQNRVVQSLRRGNAPHGPTPSPNARKPLSKKPAK